MIEEKKKHKKSKKPISAMAQVGNRVNAGIMDGITCGGMFEEGAEPESNEYNIGSDGEYSHVYEENTLKKSMIFESTEFSKDDYKKYFKQIGDYMSSHGLNVKPFPKVKLDKTKQDGLFIMTGHYEPDNKLVVLYTDGRHPKDILRTFSHEMIHHHQNLSGKNLSFSGNDNVKDNKELEKLEAEAYLKGNIYFRKWTEYFKNNGKESINESSLDEMSATDVDLSSFSLKKELNPKFWIDGHLDKRIRLKLLDLADDFINELGIDWVEPDDIIITGSLANYNWNSKFSDIDLHIVFDYSAVDDNEGFVDNYFYSQKTLWNETHKDLKIFGFPVEIFVQDSNDKLNAAGVYSLDKDKWIEKPDYDEMASHKINYKEIKEMAAEYATKIDDLYDEFDKSHDDKHKIEVVNKKAEELFDNIKEERTSGFDKDDSELNTGNLVFKTLRRMNYIGKLLDLRDKTYNIINGLD